MQLKLTVEKSTQTKNAKNPGFVNTLVGTSVMTVFGKSKTTKVRFMMRTDEELPVGSEEVIDLAHFEIKEYSNEVPSLADATKMVTLTTKWLQQKIA